MVRLVATFACKIRNKIKTISQTSEEKLEKWLNSRKAGIEVSTLLVYLMIFAYTAVFSITTILKYYAFRTYAWDLGINLQALSTTLNEGKFLYYTPELFVIPSGNYFGLHFSPIMLLLLPIYGLYQNPVNLLAFQSFILALGALPLYWFARNALGSKVAAVGFALCYLIYAPLHGANWFDFHVQAFLPLFFFLAMYYFEQEKWSKYFIFVMLALTIAESVSITVAFVGIYGVLKYRKVFFETLKRKTLQDKRILIPLATVAIAVVWYLLSRSVQNTYFPINSRFLDFYRAVNYWSVLGVPDPIGMPIYIILNPSRVVEALMYDAYLKLLFILLLFGSLLFLSLRSSIIIIAFSWLVPALLSNEAKFYILGNHYVLYLIPFLFLAAVDGMKKQRRSVNLAKFGGQIKNLLILGIVFAVFMSPLSPLMQTTQFSIPYFSSYTLPIIGEHEIALQKMVNLVPKNASILTENNIFPHFADRSNAYVWPLPAAFQYAPNEMNRYANQLIMKSDYILVDLVYDSETANAILQRLQVFNATFSVLRSEDGIYLYARHG
jgi:uncharacterized membrane protein